MRIRSTRHGNLKDLDPDVGTGGMTVVSVPSGSGRPSRAFDSAVVPAIHKFCADTVPVAHVTSDGPALDARLAQCRSVRSRPPSAGAVARPVESPQVGDAA